GVKDWLAPGDLIIISRTSFAKANLAANAQIRDSAVHSIGQKQRLLGGSTLRAGDKCGDRIGLVGNLACVSGIALDALGDCCATGCGLIAQLYLDIFTGSNRDNGLGAILADGDAGCLGIDEATWLKDKARVLREAYLGQANLPVGTTHEVTGYRSAVCLDAHFVLLRRDRHR